MKRLPFILSALAPLLLLGGCAGYQLGSVKPTYMEGVSSIAVPVFKNDTLEPRTTTIITNAVIMRLQSDGTYKVGDKNSADAVLTGTLKRIERRQLRSARFDTLVTRELRVRLVVDWELVKMIVYVLDGGTVSGDTDIFLDPNFQLSERQAFPLAAQDLAEQLVSEISEGW